MVLAAVARNTAFAVHGEGIAVQRGGAFYGRSLVEGNRIRIDNADGLTGNPTISVLGAECVLASASVDLGLAGDQPIPVVSSIDRYHISRVLVTDATVPSGDNPRGSIATGPSSVGSPTGYVVAATTTSYAALTQPDFMLEFLSAPSPLRWFNGTALYYHHSPGSTGSWRASIYVLGWALPVLP